MLKAAGTTRTALVTIFLAVAGFSYALATSDPVGTGDGGALGRAVGSGIPLAFANPIVADGSLDRDLGDVAGTGAFARSVRAIGGIPPYTFTVSSVAAFSRKSFQLIPDGLLTTQGNPVPLDLPSPFRFAVTVMDSLGSTPHVSTENFRLTFVKTKQFRFANDALPDAVQFSQYYCTVATINGIGAITFSADGLSGTGLTLASDGTLFGTPTVSGAITFTATATDVGASLAAARDGTGSSQVFTLNVQANKTLTGTISATSLTVNAGNGNGTDTVAYKGVVNLGETSIANLRGQTLSMRIGPYTAPTATFDAKGNAVTPKGVVPALKASVKKGGLLTLAVSNDLIGLANEYNATVDHPVEIRIGDAALGCETLRFAVKGSPSGAVTLTYKGTGPEDLGGTGQILSVQGADDRGGTGDAWKVSFLARIPASLSSASISSVTVEIGTNFSESVTLKNSKGNLSGKGGKTAPAVSSFSLDTKGKGSYTTGVLPSATTGISTASHAKSATFFTTNLSFKTATSLGYGIENSMGIVFSKGKWSSQ